MLTGLLLQNIALIESLELEFSSGFTVLTGEHVQPCDDADRSGSLVRLEGVSDIPMN